MDRLCCGADYVATCPIDAVNSTIESLLRNITPSIEERSHGIKTRAVAGRGALGKFGAWRKMPRVKKPQRASLDEVRIERDGEYAVITFADETVGGMHLKLGPEVHGMSDLEILDRFNEVAAAMEANVNAWDQTVIEIPAGKPQIEYAALSQQWVPIGGVLRCIIDESDDGQPTIWIDEKELSWAEFGRMLLVHNGWGMRIAFVPEEWVHEQPKIEVREPRRDKR